MAALCTVYELTPANGTWTETVLYSFRGIPDGAVPFSGPIVDTKGNVYGTTVFGGKYHPGVMYEYSCPSEAPERLRDFEPRGRRRCHPCRNDSLFKANDIPCHT